MDWGGGSAGEESRRLGGREKMNQWSSNKECSVGAPRDFSSADYPFFPILGGHVTECFY